MGAVLHADGFHAKPNTPEGTLTRFMLIYNRQRLRDVKVFHEQYSSKNEEEQKAAASADNVLVQTEERPVGAVLWNV